MDLSAPVELFVVLLPMVAFFFVLVWAQRDLPPEPIAPLFMAFAAAAPFLVMFPIFPRSVPEWLLLFVGAALVFGIALATLLRQRARIRRQSATEEAGEETARNAGGKSFTVPTFTLVLSGVAFCVFLVSMGLQGLAVADLAKRPIWPDCGYDMTNAMTVPAVVTLGCYLAFLVAAIVWGWRACSSGSAGLVVCLVAIFILPWGLVFLDAIPVMLGPESNIYYPVGCLTASR